MSETRKVDDLTLRLMKEFDFKKPFTVEILYESDGDKSPSKEIENNENRQAKELDDILSGIIGDITKAAEKSNQINPTSKKRRLSQESCKAKRAKANKQVDGYEIQVVEQRNVEQQAEIIIQNNHEISIVYRKEAQQNSINNNQTLYPAQIPNVIRSQANDQCQRYNENAIQSQQIMRNTTWQDTNNNTRQCPVNNSYTANTRQTSGSNNNEQTLISSLNNQHSTNNNIHPLISLSQMIVSQTQGDLHTKASECIETLLSTVSSHLVFVMKAWTEYMQVYKSTNKPTHAAEIAYNKYRETKYHYFYLSFASVNNSLLPRENDHVFMKKFIEYTLETARTKNILVTYQDIGTVLKELFAWVKSRGSPLLHEFLLRKEYQVRQCDNTNNTSNLRFTSELPVRDSAINVNSSAIGTNQPVQNITTPVQSLTNYQIVLQHQAPEPQSLQNSSSYVEEFQSFTRHDNHSLLRGVGKTKRGPRQRKNQPMVSVQEVQAVTLPPPPAYEDHTSVQRNYSENHLISSAYYDSLQPQNQACEVNRSLSRDSGIVSPRSPANDLNYSSVTVTPLITHVTSLNPSATQIKDGVCLVCGTATKQMCLGCYKVYYCSNRCQASKKQRRKSPHKLPKIFD